MVLRTWQRAAVGIGIAAGLAFCVALAVGFCVALGDRDQTAVAVIGTAQVDQILAPRQFDKFGGVIGSDFGVTGTPAIALSVGGVLRVVDDLAAARPRTRDVNITGSQPSSLALDPDGTMLAIADGYLGVLNQNGEIVHGLPLPYADMRLAPSSLEGFTYLFGGVGDDFRLYRFVADGTLQIVLKSDEPIVAAADGPDGIYAATASTIMRVKAGRPEILFKAPDEDFAGPIRSIAIGDDGAVFFATDTKVYVLLGPNALSIVNDAGGAIRVRDGALYVLDPQSKILFRLKPASAQLISQVAG